MSFRNTKTPNKPTTPAKWQVPMRPNAKSGVREYYLEGELKERFCKLFPKNSNRRMMAWFGISFSTLQRFKREFGLEKDMKSIIRQQSKDTKRICERNGYYASIRGLHGSRTPAPCRRLPPDKAAQSQQSTQIQETDAQEERTTQGAMAKGTSASEIRPRPSDFPPHPSQSAIAQGILPQARNDKMLQLLP